MKRRGFCIFIDTVFEGARPSVRGISPNDGGSSRDGIWIFPTELEAQREIADGMMTRLQEFLDGEREFEDAITVEDYVVEVAVSPDGAVQDKDGNCFS
jgi:hypothetical protein